MRTAVDSNVVGKICGEILHFHVVQCLDRSCNGEPHLYGSRTGVTDFTRKITVSFDSPRSLI